MTKISVSAIGLLFVTTTLAAAHDEKALMNEPAGDPYVQVSDVLPLPEFIPGLGTLFVDPATLPAGPFLAYDRDGQLSATIYMTPLDDLQNGVSFDGLGLGSHTVSSTDVYFNAGHPGVEKPHAHVVLFHDEGAKERLAE
ncbi:hypothetical protein [Ruegeria atlantica]|uniref:Uncharacterized protein n=1 Tax=Ruegeria atlantica TaxID=81569 RepID=A0A0P1ERA0_9RHOB|nr:hypothetical protein [Ruegeria atlantica]CUH44582.1 hypothetical protein RUM4293_03488 [Ruegeria atlantica]